MYEYHFIDLIINLNVGYQSFHEIINLHNFI